MPTSCVLFVFVKVHVAEDPADAHSPDHVKPGATSPQGAAARATSVTTVPTGTFQVQLPPAQTPSSRGPSGVDASITPPDALLPTVATNAEGAPHVAHESGSASESSLGTLAHVCVKPSSQ
jgi:hypothetical protein